MNAAQTFSTYLNVFDWEQKYCQYNLCIFKDLQMCNKKQICTVSALMVKLQSQDLLQNPECG